MTKLGKNIIFPIYRDVNGIRTPFHDLALHKSTSDSIVMSLGDKITGDVYYKNNALDVTMTEYILVKRNPDDANEQAVKFVLVNPPTIVREGMVADNSQLKGMTKYSFTFYHPMYMLGNLPFADVAVTDEEKRYLSESKKFNWIGNAQDYVAKLNKNLQGTEFVVRISDTLYNDPETRLSPKEEITRLSDVLTFDDAMIADALKTFYDTYGIPFVIDILPSTDSDYASGKRYLILMGLPSETIVDGQGNEFVFQFGQGVGLKNNSRTPRNNKIVTRVAGFGSEENIPYGYPQIRWYGPSDWTNTKNDESDPTSYPIYEGIVGGELVKLIKHPFTRTHLMPTIYETTVFNKVSPYVENGSANPDYDPDTTLVDYYDATAEKGYPNPINPNAPSYESHEFADIKPQLGHETGITSAIPQKWDGTTYVDDDHWDDTMNDDSKYIQSYFKIGLPILPFDLYASAAITQQMNVVMRSGACLGCTFPVQIDWDDYKANFFNADGVFDPIPHTTEGDGHVRDITKYPDSSQTAIDILVEKENTTFGVVMPNIYQNPTAGDEIVFTGISLPQSYITMAQALLDQAMDDWMMENNVYYWDYPLKFDEDFLSKHTDILAQIRPNVRVSFMFANDTLTLYVKQLVIKYGEKVLPQYDITLTDDIEATRNAIGQAQADIGGLHTGLDRIGQAVQEITRKDRIQPSGSPTLPVYVNGNNEFKAIEGLNVPKNVEAGYGVAAYGMASLAMNGGGGQGTVTAINFEGAPERIYTPSDGLITLPDYPSLDGYATQAWVTNNFADKAFEGRVTAIESKIPAQASSTNQLADKNFVNSSVATATAEFQGTYDVVEDLGLTASATHAQIQSALLTAVASQQPDNNDYVFVSIPAVSGASGKYERYKFNGTSWAYEYTLNNSSFTAAQWASITSGITSAKVLDYDTHIARTDNPHGVTKAQVGLGNVENTALSTWTGTIKIVTLGTITTGVWHGSAIADDYIASASAWNAKYDKDPNGIPKTDLASAVQTSLGKADTALQSESDPVFTASAAYGITSANINEWNAKQNALAFDGTYDASTNKVATKSTVTNAINALDVSNISGFGAGKTLASLTEADGKIAATFQNISITKSQVSDFPTTWALANITGADDLKAIEALTGTSGFLKKTAANKWALDTDVASGTALSDVSTRVGDLEGYFDANGVANSAAKLNTAHNLWGQSFNGSADVNGDIAFSSASMITCVDSSSNAVNLFQYTSNNIFRLGYGQATKDTLNIYGKAVNIRANGLTDGVADAYIKVANGGTVDIKGTLSVLNNASFAGTATIASHITSTNGNIQALNGGVSASGIASLAMNGGGGQGTLTQIQVNGVALADTSGVVNITATTGNAAGKIAIAGQQIPVYGLGSFAYLSSLAFTDLSSHPTTLGGYGITDAKIANGVITLGGNTITPITSLPTFYNLAFQNASGTTVDTYKPTTSPSKTIKAGSNVTISASSNVITIAATDTTYESKAAASGGTAVSLVTTGEKYTWNNKQNAISDLATIRSNASNGNTAYGWGNHADAGYFAASSFTKANIKSTLGISDWALAASKPSYAFSEITGTVTNAQLAGSIANNKLASAGKFTIGSTAIELGTTYTAANFRSYLGLGGAATYGATSSVTDGGTSLVTSGGVYSYVNALLTAAMKIEGETTTAISDGSTTNPVTIGGQSVNAYKGMVVFYGSKEFVWVGTAWKELGDESSFALKTTTVSGTGYLTGGGALSSNQTIDIASSVKTNIDNGATAYGWGNHANEGYVKAATDDTISGLKTFSHGIFVQGRVYNSGDDEGIVIKKANNGYAGVTLIKNSVYGIRTAFYLNANDKALWVYNNGTTSYSIYHPEKSGTIALTTDIPTKLSDFTDDLGTSPTHTHSQYAIAANLGTASTHAHEDYVTAIGVSGNTLTWSKGGTAQTAITVPYATAAGKLNTNAGSATSPVYFANGVPVACTYSLNKTVPADAVFTDTNTHRPIQLNGTEILGNNTTALNLKAGTGVSLTNSSGTVTFDNSGVRAATINGNYLRINTNGTNADLTIPYATNANYAATAGSAPASDVYPWAKASTKPSYTLSEISDRQQSYIEWGGPNIVGSVSPLEVATIDDLGHNKFAFASAATVTVQYSRDGGSTWTAFGTDAERRSLVTLTQGFYIGNRTGSSNTTNDKLRVILNANRAGGNIYTALRRLLLYVSTNGSGGCTVKVEHRTIANYNNNVDTWNTIGTYGLSGWSGWNSIPCGLTFGGSSDQTTQSAQVRLTFGVTSVSTTYGNFVLQAIRGIGFPLWQSPSTMASTGHLYSYDISQNAAFPAGVSATSFTENGTALSSKYLGINANAVSATKATQDGDGNTISSTYLKLSGGTMAGTVKWDSISLPQKNSSPYAVVIDAFASGGEMGWRQLGSNAFDSTAYLPLAGGTMSNTTVVTNLNADLLDGQHGSYYAVKAASKGSTTKPIYTDANGAFQECSTYAGGTAVTLNGSSKAASTASFYAPTGAGTSGQILKSSGSGAPTWVNQSTITAGALTTTSKTAWGQTFWTSDGIPATISGNMTNVGNIAFSASGKNIGGTMYFDTTNHRIGINDSTPSCAFDVTGDVQASGGIAAGGILNLAYNGAGTQGTLTQIQVNGRALTDTSGIVNIPLANTTSTGDGAMSHSDKLKLDGIATGATNVNTDTVAGWGYTKNAGTVTGVKMNGSVKGSSGVVDLGTVITDVSGKADKQMNVLVDNNGSATITMTNSTTARYHFVRYPSSSSVTAITLQQATSALTAANCGTAHYELFKNEKSTAITLTLTKYSNSSYYLIAPSKTITIPANSSVELSYIHIAGASSTFYTVVTIGDVMINVS